MPRNLEDALANNLDSPRLHIHYLLKIEFVGYTLRVWNGYKSVTYDSETYEALGVVTDWPTVKETVELRANNISFELSGDYEYDIDISDVTKYRNANCEIFIYASDSEVGTGNIEDYNTYRIFKGNISDVGFVEDAKQNVYTVTAESKLIELSKSKKLRYTHESQIEKYSGGVELSSPDSLVVGETYEVTTVGTGADFSAAGGPSTPALGDLFVATGTSVTWGTAELTSVQDNGLQYATNAQVSLEFSRQETPKQPYMRKVIYGQTKVEGSLVFLSTSGAGSRYLNMVFAFADHECESIEQVYLDDRQILDNGTVVGEYAGNVTYYERLGTDNQEYISELSTEMPDGLWDESYRLRGITYIYIRCTYDEDLFGQEAPVVTALIKGKKLYDPRDTTTAYSDNPALAVRDYLTNSDYGFAALTSEIDEDSFKIAATDCESAVAKKDGGSENRYTINGCLSTNDTTGENLKTMLNCMAGEVAYTGGTFGLYVGLYRPPSASIDDNHVVTQYVATNKNLHDSYNTCRGIYKTPLLDWREEEYPSYVLSSAVTDDGQTKAIDLPLPFTTSPSMAQRLAKIAVTQSRNIFEVEADLMINNLKVRCGDTISIVSTAFTFKNLVYEVQSMDIVLDVTPKVIIRAKEISSDDYAWDEATEEKEIVAPDKPADSILAWTLARLASPTASPASKSFVDSFDVTVSHNETGVTCHFTTDNSEPTESDSTVADGGTITIPTADTTLKLKTFDNVETITSEVTTYEYSYDPPLEILSEPEFRVSNLRSIPNTVGNSPLLKIRSNENNAKLYFSSNYGVTYTLLNGNTDTTTSYSTGVRIRGDYDPSRYRSYVTNQDGSEISGQKLMPAKLILMINQYSTADYRVGILNSGVEVYEQARFQGGSFNNFSLFAVTPLTNRILGFDDDTYANLLRNGQGIDRQYYLSKSGWEDSDIGFASYNFQMGLIPDEIALG